MTKKKNRVSIFGKTFHVTPAGKILPLGGKNNWFTKCMNQGLKGQQAKGVGADTAGNRARFASRVATCKPLRPGGPAALAGGFPAAVAGAGL